MKKEKEVFGGIIMKTLFNIFILSFLTLVLVSCGMERREMVDATDINPDPAGPALGCQTDEDCGEENVCEVETGLCLPQEEPTFICRDIDELMIIEEERCFERCPHSRECIESVDSVGSSSPPTCWLIDQKLALDYKNNYKCVVLSSSE
jgi:hypothetical protein